MIFFLIIKIWWLKKHFFNKFFWFDHWSKIIFRPFFNMTSLPSSALPDVLQLQDVAKTDYVIRVATQSLSRQMEGSLISWSTSYQRTPQPLISKTTSKRYWEIQLKLTKPMLSADFLVNLNSLLRHYNVGGRHIFLL